MKTCFANDRISGVEPFPPRRARRTAGGGKSVGRFVALGVCCAVIVCLLAVPASAQGRRPVPKGSPRGGGVLEKLESFQSSVKRRLKTALGVEPEPSASSAGESRGQASPRGEAAQGSSTRGPALSAGRSHSQPQFQPRVRNVQPGWEGEGGAIVQQAAGMQPDAEPAGPPRVAVAVAEPGTARGQPSVASNDATHRAVDYRQVVGEMPRYGSSAEPLPPPLPDPDASSTPQWNDQDFAATAADPPPASRRSTAASNSVAPAARGTVLGGNPVTATEHALRLLEENGDLKARLAMMEAENVRLKQQLVETQTTLQRSTAAIEQAKQEIDALVTENRQLTAELQAAETRYNRHLMETDRMLQSIRDELDDVLVREISATGR